MVPVSGAAGGGLRHALALLLPLAVAGARFKPLLAVLMLAIFAAHQPIGHKEIRFLYPLMVLLEALAAIGLAWAVARLQELLPRLDLPWRPSRAWLPAAAALGCLTLFVVGRLATFVIIPDQGLAWLKQRSIIEAARHIARLPGVCGIGSYGIAWVQSGGYVNMHQPVPFHETTTVAAFREAAGLQHDPVSAEPAGGAWHHRRQVLRPAMRGAAPGALRGTADRAAQRSAAAARA